MYARAPGQPADEGWLGFAPVPNERSPKMKRQICGTGQTRGRIRGCWRLLGGEEASHLETGLGS
jgi:hypothetical protein